MLRRGFLGLVLVVVAAGLQAQQVRVVSPPMGWNSWDSYGLTITEAQFRDNVRVMKDKLLPFGWRYAVVDEGWYFENPQDRSKPLTLRYAIDKHGRYVPVPVRFPSAVEPKRLGPVRSACCGGAVPMTTLQATVEETSFRPLADWVHAQGLLFGIHIVRGIPRVSVERQLPIEGSGFHAQDAADTTDACPWDPTNWGVQDNAAGQAWYDSLLRQYAGWGVDLLKVDCIADHPYKAAEIRMIRRAMDKAGRPMVLSLSPGPTALEHADEVGSFANMWRISNDVWDVWESKPGSDFPQSLKGQFDRAAAWVPMDFGAGRWPDLDMLPLGELRPSPGWGRPRSSKLNLDEQRTMLTLWAMKQSPLILGANLTLLDEATLKLVTNRDLIHLDQALEMHSGQVQPNEGNPPLPASEKDLRIWSAATPELASVDRGGMYAAMFNLGDVPLTVDVSIGDLNLLRSEDKVQSVVLYDVWSGKSLGRVSQVKATIPAHGCLLLRRGRRCSEGCGVPFIPQSARYEWGTRMWCYFEAQSTWKPSSLAREHAGCPARSQCCCRRYRRARFRRGKGWLGGICTFRRASSCFQTACSRRGSELC
jgi:alpha-galactosidase